MPAMTVSPAGWVFLFLTTVFLPYAAIRGGLRAKKPGGTPTRAQLLISIFTTQGIGLLISLLAARYEEVELFPAPDPGWKNLGMAVAFLVPSLGTLAMRWRWKSEEEKRNALWFLPQKPRDLGWWTLVSLVAGTVEEIMYRGVMLVLWEKILGGWWPAVCVCSLAFALAHFVQGTKAMAVIALLAVADHWVVLASGDLYTAMAIHFVYDLLAGVILMRLARRDGIAEKLTTA